MFYIKKSYVSRQHGASEKRLWKLPQSYNPAKNYLIKVNSRKARRSFEICSVHVRRVLVRHARSHRRRSGVFIFNFERISHIFLVFLLLTLNGKMFARKVIPKVIHMSTNFQRCAKKAWKYLLPKYFCYIEVCTLVYKMFLKYFVGNVYFQESGC